MSTVVILRPERDQVEKVFSTWADQLLSASEGSGLVIRDLRGPAVTRDSIRDALSDTAIVIFFGHGGPGEWGRPPLASLYTETDLEGGATQAIVAVACSSAQIFGRAAVERGSTSQFVGFFESLTAFIPQSKAFGKAITQALRLLFDGTPSADRCADALRAGFRVQENLYQPNGGLLNGLPDAAMIYLCALSNRQAVRGYPSDPFGR